MGCKVCGKSIGRNKNCCSMECYAIYKSHKKTCIVCGKEFYCSPSADTVTCNAECSKCNRQIKHLNGSYNDSLNKAHEAIKTSPLTGKFATHMRAKEWVIQSPDGEIYRCRNLLNWLREHEDLIDGTPKQAWDGIVKIKYSMQGKRKNPSKSWKGWTLIEFGD